jgi:hypothetical protein
MSISDKDWFEGNNDKIVVLLEHLCNMGIWIPDGEYEAWIEPKAGDSIDVASNPPEVTVETLRKSFMMIFREKVISVIDTWNTLAEKLVDDEIVSKPPTVELEEAIEFVAKNWKIGQVPNEKEKDSE